MDKLTLRKWIRQQKQAMTPEDIADRSAQLCRRFLSGEAYRAANTIYGYLPYNQEVRILPILEQALRDGKSVALPKCRGSRMWFVYMTDFSQIQRGIAGVPEPVLDDPVASDPTALVLMPGLAFDRDGRRIGYGGGFYDRFLSAEPNHPTVALCYDFQILPKLPTEDFDVPVDTVIWA